MTFANPGRPGATIALTATILAGDPPRRLAWRGRVPLLFSRIHDLELRPAAGGTDLLHGEELAGLVPRRWPPARRAKQRAVCEAMNDALARRLDALA